jgi:hypothetical protein
MREKQIFFTNTRSRCQMFEMSETKRSSTEVQESKIFVFRRIVYL